VIREYSLLLNPAGTADTHRASEVAAMTVPDAKAPQPKLPDASQAAMLSSM
jgi:hypothetical protein